MKASEEARRLFSYLLPLIQRAVSGAGGGSPSPHALSSIHHTGTLNNAQGPQFLLSNGTRPLQGNLAVNPGVSIDGVDLSAHAANPNAHHDAATGMSGITVTGQVISLLLAAAPGFEISGSGVRVKECHGIFRDTNGISILRQTTSGLDLNASGLAIADSIAGGGLIIASKVLAVNPGDGIDILTDQVTVDVTDIIDFGAGLGEDGSNNIQVKRASPDSGLAFDISGGLTLGTPSNVSVNSVNSLLGMGMSHSHAVVASSDVGTSPSAQILKSTPAGGLGLASMFTTGAVDVGQGFTAGNTGFRVIYHTHAVINPTGGWTLDEQFGLDVDDNLLVRGWIVGKHAIQVKDAKMLVHFDRPQPVETNYVGNPTGHMGQVGVLSGGAIFREGRFGKAIQTGEGTTNLVTNPSFETGTAGWTPFGTGVSLSTHAGEGSTGSYAMRIASPTTPASGANYDINLTSGVTYTWSLKLRHSNSVNIGNPIRVRVRRGDNGVVVLDTSVDPPDGGWYYANATFTAPFTGTHNFRIYYSGSVLGNIYVDEVQIEAKSYATPYCDGSLGTGHTWSGTAHASTSTRGQAHVQYDDEALDDVATPMTVMAWIKPASNGSYQVICSKTDGGVTEGWELANSAGTLRATLYGSTVEAFSSAGALTVGEWHHVAFTYNGATLRLYLNGVKMANGSGSSTVKTDNDFLVGVRPSGSYFNGSIDEVSLIERALTADEIRAIYESNAPIFDETSTWHWRAGRNRIYADAKGFWGYGANSGTILGLYAGEGNNPSATKSWGGVNLSEGDLLLGRYGVSNGGWMLFDQDLVGGNPALRFGYADKDVIRFDSGGASLYGVLDIDSNGGIYQGSGSFASPTTGLKVWNDSGVGRIGGYNSGTLQWYANTDGKLYAGGGNVILDASGLALGLTSYPIRFIDGSGNVIGSIWQRNDLGSPTRYEMELSAGHSTRDGAIRLQARNTAGSIITTINVDATETGSGAGITTFGQQINLVANDSFVEVIPQLSVFQPSTTAAIPAMQIQQNDLSEEFIQFNSTVGASNPISQSALGAYWGKLRVSVNGTMKSVALYDYELTMAFARENAILPSKIADIAIELFDPDPDSEEIQRATARIQVVMDDGRVQERQVNLAEHLSAQTLGQLQALAAMIRAKAELETLPEKALVAQGGR